MQRKSQYLSRILALLFVLLLTPACFVNASAAEVPKDASCEVKYVIDNTPVANAQVNLYRVATVNRYGAVEWTETFQDYRLALSLNDTAQLSELAKTLSSLITKDFITPTVSKATDADGTALFDGLEFGMYLVDGPTYTSGRYKHHIVPAFIILPYLDVDNTLVYSAKIELKHDSRYIPPDTPSTPSTTYRKVLKVWEDDNSAERPESITVELLRDGKPWDTVELNEKNNWRHSWTNLSQQYDWTVVEENVPEGYMVTIQKEQKTFVITNTANDPKVPTSSSPIDPELPTPPATPPTPTTPTTPTTPPTPPTPPHTEEKLPQTGQLMWPVPIMASAGICLLIAGILIRKKEGA